MNQEINGLVQQQQQQITTASPPNTLVGTTSPSLTNVIVPTLNGNGSSPNITHQFNGEQQQFDKVQESKDIINNINGIMTTPIKQMAPQYQTPQQHQIPQSITTPTQQSNQFNQSGLVGFPLGNFSTPQSQIANQNISTTAVNSFPFNLFNTNLQSPQNIQQLQQFQAQQAQQQFQAQQAQQQLQLQLQQQLQAQQVQQQQLQAQQAQQQQQQQQPVQQTPSKITPTRAAAVAATAAAQSQISEQEPPPPEQKPGVTYQTCQHPSHTKWWGTASLLPINEFYPRASKCKKCYIKQQQDARKSKTQPGLPIIDDSLSNITPIKNLQPFLNFKPTLTPTQIPNLNQSTLTPTQIPNLNQQTPISNSTIPNLTPHHHHMGGLPIGLNLTNQVPPVSPFSHHHHQQQQAQISQQSQTPHHLHHQIVTPSTGMILPHGGIPSRQQNELLKQQFLLQQNQVTLQHAQQQLLQAQSQAHFSHDRDLGVRHNLIKQGYRPKQRPNKQYIRKEMFERLKRYLINLLQDERSKPFREPVDIATLPDYNEKIKTPMDLGTIEKRLSNTVNDLSKIIILPQENDESEKKEREIQQEIEKQQQDSTSIVKYYDIKQIDRDIRLVFNNALEYYKQQQQQQEQDEIYQFANDLEREYQDYFKVNLEQVLAQASYQCELLKFVCDGCKQPPVSYQQPPTVDINGNIIQHEATDILPLITCQGSCLRSFHLHCLALQCVPEQTRIQYICRECIHGKPVLHYDPEENKYFYFYFEGINSNNNGQEEFKLNLSSSLKLQLLNLLNSNKNISIDNNNSSSSSSSSNNNNNNNNDNNSNNSDKIISDIGTLDKIDKVQLRKVEEESRLREMYYDPYWCMWRKKITSKREDRQRPMLESHLKKKVKKVSTKNII